MNPSGITPLDVFNSLMIATILLIAIGLLLKSKGWDAPTIAAAVSKLWQEQSEIRRVQKRHDLDINGLRSEKDRIEGRVDVLNDRVTGVEQRLSVLEPGIPEEN